MFQAHTFQAFVLRKIKAEFVWESGYFSRYSDGLRARWPGFESRQGQDFSILHGFQTHSVAHPASYLMDCFSEGKAPGGGGGEIHHSLPSSAEVRNGGAIPPKLN
jgi:hypothetical protein